MNNTPTKKLSENQAWFVSLIEQAYYTTGSIPTNDYISDKLSISLATVARYWNDETVRKALVTRGIDLRPEKSQELVTPIQLQVANAVLNIVDKRPLKTKLEDFGVSPQQYSAWLRQPAFFNYLNKRAEQMFSTGDHAAFLALMKNIETGDTRSIQLFMEMRGKYSPRAQIDMNIEVVLARIVEVVAKHIQDPITLQNIAAEIDSLTGVGAPLTVPPVSPGLSSLPPLNPPTNGNGNSNDKGENDPDDDGGITF